MDEKQLYEVYGLKEPVVKNILNDFTIKSQQNIKTINVNTAGVKELASNVYIRYRLAEEIIAYRTRHHKVESIRELTKIQGFPSEKIDLIEVYLKID